MKTALKAPTLRLRKRPGEDATEHPDVDPGDGVGQSQLSWTGSSALATKLTSFALLACLAAGAIALVGVLVLASSPTPTPTQVAAGVDEQAGERAAVESLAQDMVVTWLTSARGEEDRLAAYLPDSSWITLPEKPRIATGATVADVEQTEDGTWSVTVAVHVTDSSDHKPTVRYFVVPVTYYEGAVGARALPMPVAAPRIAAAGDPDAGYRFALDSQATVADAASDFLTAYLTGRGDVTRVVSPETVIDPVVPAPYKRVELEDVRSSTEITDADETPETGRETQLMITAVALGASEREISVQYVLTMRAREGRWEVAGIDPAPLPRETDEQPTPSDTASPIATNPTATDGAEQ